MATPDPHRLAQLRKRYKDARDDLQQAEADYDARNPPPAPAWAGQQAVRSHRERRERALRKEHARVARAAKALEQASPSQTPLL